MAFEAQQPFPVSFSLSSSPSPPSSLGVQPLDFLSPFVTPKADVGGSQVWEEWPVSTRENTAQDEHFEQLSHGSQAEPTRESDEGTIVWPRVVVPRSAFLQMHARSLERSSSLTTSGWQEFESEGQHDLESKSCDERELDGFCDQCGLDSAQSAEGDDTAITAMQEPDPLASSVAIDELELELDLLLGEICDRDQLPRSTRGGGGLCTGHFSRQTSSREGTSPVDNFLENRPEAVSEWESLREQIENQKKFIESLQNQLRAADSKTLSLEAALANVENPAVQAAGVVGHSSGRKIDRPRSCRYGWLPQSCPSCPSANVTDRNRCDDVDRNDSDSVAEDLHSKSTGAVGVLTYVRG
eukprot:CAMPEP_0206476112 /NCGR_PEP_ID=MMETSP0324_2-20121206/34514_1 /ASSEMBLY_ACC=CAM_ASM_000836 /TAXON_ID=2866 /ORGANISM="Crypthecodinium cohnii, Strain Seligo" /LENGTH=354 /DNA_ID=CAMNT_0053951665 /DNA_START=125 /DNA_END=1189 /DNA_ORIENTATION=+